MTSDASDFQLEEYKSLRAEIIERIREANTLIITSAGGVGAAYAVIVSTFAREPHLKFSHASTFTILSFLVIVWTPVLFAVLGRIKSRDVWITVQQLASQIRTIELFQHHHPPDFVAWEHQMEIFRAAPKPFSYRLAYGPYGMVYGGMITITLVVALGSTGYIVFMCLRKAGIG